MNIEFTDLRFTVNKGWIFSKGNKVEILKGVSGRFESGQLSAILGPSGAGKSSLLNAISGYRSAGVSGSMRVNGEPKVEGRFRKMSCFIAQEDVLQPMLTLEELMMFAASLKLPPRSDRKHRSATVEEIQSMLGLEVCRQTRTECLSGGQKKRLSIALELINNPPVIFLDEPTSGLDNVSAGNLVRLLQRLAHEGRTIVATIHQPSASLFALFDHAYVLASGSCVFQGDTRQLLPFLSSLGLHCPKHYNPADYVIEMTDSGCEENIDILSAATQNGKLSRHRDGPSLVKVDDALTSKDCLEKGEQFNSEQSKKRLADTLLKYESLRNTSCLKDICAELNTSWWYQFYVILCRMLLQTRRNKLGLKLQFYHHLGCGLTIGIVFWGSATDGDQFFNHMKFCMGVILFHAYTYCMVPVLSFPYEVKLLKKEHFNQWYSLGPYYLALSFSKIPTIASFSIMFIVMVYYMSGLPLEIYRFIVFSIIGVMVAFVSEGMGLAIGSIFSVTNGTAVGPMSLAPFLGFAIYGFDFAREIPWWAWPLLKTSFLRSGVIALIIAVFGMGRERMECSDPVYCHFSDPRVTIHYLNLEGVSPWSEIALLFAALALFRLLCYLALRWRLRT